MSSEDSHRPERVCVVDEDFARRYWPNGGALGQRLAHGDESDEAKLFTVVGVVGAVKQAELTEAAGQGAIYLPYAHHGKAAGCFRRRHARARTPEAFAETLRQAGPRNATLRSRSITFARWIPCMADSLIARRSPALLAGVFAGVALLLAAIGTYGVLSYAVAQRTREIGIRMALGAQRKQISAQFLKAGLRLLLLGLALGMIGAVVSGRSMQSVLYDVSAFQFTTFAATAAVLTVVCLVACWLPALRAARVDPMEALRSE